MHMIELDPVKAALNLEKHGIAFADMEPVFHDEKAFESRSDRMTALGTMEERYITTGRDALDRIVTVRVDASRWEPPLDLSASGAHRGEVRL